jgi:hypothetical protein
MAATCDDAARKAAIVALAALLDACAGDAGLTQVIVVLPARVNRPTFLRAAAQLLTPGPASFPAPGVPACDRGAGMGAADACETGLGTGEPVLAAAACVGSAIADKPTAAIITLLSPDLMFSVLSYER